MRYFSFFARISLFFCILFSFSCSKEEPADPVYQKYCNVISARYDVAGGGSHTRIFYPRSFGEEKMQVVYDDGMSSIYKISYSGTYRASKITYDSLKSTQIDYNGDYSRFFRITNADHSMPAGPNTTGGQNYFEHNAKNQVLKKRYHYLIADSLKFVYYKSFEYTYDQADRVAVRKEFSIKKDTIFTLKKTLEYSYLPNSKHSFVTLGLIENEVDDLNLKHVYDEGEIFNISAVREILFNGQINNYSYEYEFNPENYPIKVKKKKNGVLVYTITINYDTCR